MPVSTRQRKEVEQRIEFACITNMQQENYRHDHIINLSGCVALAFALGTRFGLAHPYLAGDYLARWITDRKPAGEDAGIVGVKHQRALEACLFTIHNPQEDINDD